MSIAGAAPRAAFPLSPARAEASRRNGAKSCGPKSAEGKARSAQNALKHGLRAQKHLVLANENAADFAALEAALVEELAPEGVLQTILAQRIARAAWRLERADRLEIEVLAWTSHEAAGPGLALIRDNNGSRSVETLVRYRGAAMAELMRSLRALKALQAEAREAAMPSAAAARPLPRRDETPIEPKSCGNPGGSARPGDRVDPGKVDPRPAPARLPQRPLPPAGEAASRVQPIEPEPREQPAKLSSETGAPLRSYPERPCPSAAGGRDLVRCGISGESMRAPAARKMRPQGTRQR
jgi:hypothetical protein